jgi:predicted ATPase
LANGFVRVSALPRGYVKVAFSGTHGAGKTVAVEGAAEAARAAGLKVAVGPEVARGCPFPVNEEGTGSAQTWIMASQIAQEVVLEESGAQLVLLDRCVFDHVAYSRWLHKRGRMTAEELSFVESAALQWAAARPYTAIVFMQPAKPPEDDGFRSTNADFQREVHAILQCIYMELDIKKTVRLFVQTGSELELNMVLSAIVKEVTAFKPTHI